MNLREKLESGEHLNEMERASLASMLDEQEHLRKWAEIGIRLKMELPVIIEEARQDAAKEVCERIQEEYDIDEDDDPFIFPARRRRSRDGDSA